MRADMAKVIVERPRGGSRLKKHKGAQRRLQRTPMDEWVRRDRLVGRHTRSKHLSEHLGPLRRYLLANVGRPWDKVFSEICAHINRNSAVQDHVRDHVADFVEVHVVLIDGVPCSGDSRFYGQPLGRFLWRELYVCPRTGLLRRVKQRSVKKARKLSQFIKVGPLQQYHRIDDAVYLVTLLPLPLNHLMTSHGEVDVVLGQHLWQVPTSVLVQAYGGRFYAVQKRRLGKRELRQTPVPVDWWK